MDPLFFEWLEYRAAYHKLANVHLLRSDSQQLIAEGTSSDTTRKKTFPSLHESVHSSSDKEKRKAMTERSKTLRNEEAQRKDEFKMEDEQVFRYHL
jgi:vacuolar protein sorting-associated protein 13B